MSKNFWVWCLLSVDVVFHDFCRRKFPTFSEGGAVRKSFGKLLGYLVGFVSRKGIFYLLVFVDISNLCFWFANLKFGISDLSFPEIFGMWISCDFTFSEFTWISWIDALFLEIFHFCCSCDTLICVENHLLNSFRWLHVRGYATTYIILISLLLGF